MSWSTPIKITNSNYYTHLLGENAEGVYYYQTGKGARFNNIQIIALDHNMKSKARQEFLPSSKQYLHKAVLVKNGLILFYSEVDKKNNEVNLFAKRINGKLEEVGQDIKISSINGNQLNRDYFTVVGSHYLDEIVVAQPNNSDSLSGPFTVSLYNSQLELQKKSNLDLKVRYDGITKSYLRNGIWHFVAGKEAKSGIFNRVKRKVLFRHNARLGSTNSIKLFNEEYNTTEGDFHFGPADSTVVFSSLYYQKDSLEPLGYFSASLNFNNDRIDVRKNPFPKVMIEDLFGKGKTEVEKGELLHQKTIQRSDGGIIFISEKREIDAQVIQDISLYGTPQNYTRYYYYYYDISVLSLNPNGTVDWHKTIKKEQITLNDEGYYSSFGCEVTSNALLFIYNDLSRKSGNVLMYGINPNGEGSSEILINGREFDGYAIPKESVQLSANSLIVPMVKPREGFTLLRLDF
ncbi:MAG: hypothetical protein KDC92_03570 [Bacteroidetes bacterium]|nr:hypothetical protein [Bacteroidota bacterium]